MSELELHLESCPACRNFLEQAGGAAESWLEIARNLQTATCETDASFAIAVDRLKKRWQFPHSDEVTAPLNLPLGFLEAPGEPGRLGRLDQFEIIEEVGRGAMGGVFKAEDTSLKRVVAIKVLRPERATIPSFRERFVHEAQAMASVKHPRVVSIHAVGESVRLPYFVMEFIQGKSLEQKLHKEDPLPLDKILLISLQIAEGLTAIHGNGQVHRDLKPGNILLENHVESVKIGDFGLAHSIGDPRLTEPGSIVGTPHYMSPEQAACEQTGHRSDLFAFGSVLFAMCAGQPPFPGEDAYAVLRDVRHKTAPRVEESREDIPYQLSELIAQLLQKRPEDRPQTAAEVAERLRKLLQDFASGRLVVTRRSRSAIKSVVRRRRLQILLSLAVAVLLALLFWPPSRTAVLGTGSVSPVIISDRPPAEQPTVMASAPPVPVDLVINDKAIPVSLSPNGYAAAVGWFKRQSGKGKEQHVSVRFSGVLPERRLCVQAFPLPPGVWAQAMFKWRTRSEMLEDKDEGSGRGHRCFFRDFKDLRPAPDNYVTVDIGSFKDVAGQELDEVQVVFVAWQPREWADTDPDSIGVESSPVTIRDGYGAVPDPRVKDPLTAQHPVLDGTADIDVFQVTATTSGLVDVTVDGSSGEFWPYLRVFDEKVTLLAETPLFRGRFVKHLAFDAKSGVTYYLAVSANDAQSRGNYGLRVQTAGDGEQ